MLKRFRVPIFTEEYAVNVFIGRRDLALKAASKYMHRSFADISKETEDMRGMAWDCFTNPYKCLPCIFVDGDLPAHIGLATLAHEASHALDFIQDHISLWDRRGEFHGHGIAAIMRAVGKFYLEKSHAKK